MRVLQAPAPNGYAENGSIVRHILSAESTTASAEFGNNNENYRIHSNSNVERSTTNNSTTATTSSHQQNLHNCRTSTKKFICEGTQIDSADGTELKEHQNNFITDRPGLGVVDSLQNVDSSNNSFYEDCVNGFANLERFRRTSGSVHNTEETSNGPTKANAASTFQKADNPSQQHSGKSTPSFEEIHLDNFALERELNRIIRGTSISDACEDDNSCNCKSLQESLKSYELVRDNSETGLVKNDGNVSDHDDDDDYDDDDDQMDPHYNAESITRSSELSPDDSLMDDEDEEYLSSQASSCTSVSTPQRSHFPRGIINPNYPGFQHLAHTLSEHYIDHQSSDPYDSDLSEYEMELSVDSFDCDFIDGSGSSSIGNNNNNHNNNNNLNTVMVINNNLIDSQLLDKTSTMDDNEDNFNTKPSTETTGGGGGVDGGGGGGGGGGSVTPLPLINITQSLSDTNRNTAEDEQSNNLQTLLKLYDVTTQQQENERNKSLEIEIPQEEGNFGCPTPDILIKNYSSERYSRRPKPENRPDLLRNVSPNPPPMKCRFEAILHEDEDKLRQHSSERNSPPDTLCTNSEGSKNDTGRDDISLGLTPVDIIGDFGREVEREFGLIVSGYNSRLEYVNYSTGAFYLYNVGERVQAEKMSDALLSNGTEQIATSKYTAAGLKDPLSHQSMPNQPDASTLDTTYNSHMELLDGKENFETSECSADTADRSTTHQQQHQNQQPNDHNDAFSENSQKTRSSISVADPPENHDPVQSNRGTGEHSPDKNIPTAIVKPKYQKSSYDERQLPPIGLDFNVKSRAWFDCPSTSNGSSNARSIKKSQNTERNSKIFKSTKFTRGNNNNNNNNNNSAASRFGAAARRSGNNNKTKLNCMVAVVPPMMKDPEDLQATDNEDQIDNKPVEPHCTRYGIATWAASLKDSKRSQSKRDEISPDPPACFDVYNIETALPEINLEEIEAHLKRVSDEERRRRNDREEIRRRLAMGAEDDYFSKIVTNNVRTGRKPSLQSRLQSGKNIQLCFMNEASSDTESHSSDSETCPKLSRMVTRNRNEIPNLFATIDIPDHPYNANPLSVNCTNNNPRKPRQPGDGPHTDDDKECDFFTRQARLQIEARMALSQAKDMAHMQMELDRQKQRLSPITGIIRGSMEKVGVLMAPDKRRVSRQILTDMNIAQLQIIVNELHTQIEDLNDSLVHYLMERDDLHMGQDSMLVDIEDISRFLSAKELDDDQ